jgi:His-Xaa-Ser system protein HxsD
VIPIIRRDGELTFLVEDSIYSRIALLKTCYWFTDRAFVFVYRYDERHLGVILRLKHPGPELETIAGEFGNSLLDHQLRTEIERETATVRELIIAKAFADTDALDDVPVGDDRDPVELARMPPDKTSSGK